MELHDIPLDRFKFDPLIIKNRWLLLGAGDFRAGRASPALGPLPYNAMTISWASVGQMWNKLFFQVFVRPSRYTYGLLEKSDGFTLSVFPSASKPALNLLGSKSGRDGDKIAASGLHPIASRIVTAPSFEEAELAVECRKIYWQDIDPEHFIGSGIMEHYAKGDYHRAYFGEILGLRGTDFYRA
jgi:flavin reductase (DIM6/NTAB) family NADH-FMN oxidoreductase RutF